MPALVFWMVMAGSVVALCVVAGLRSRRRHTAATRQAAAAADHETSVAAYRASVEEWETRRRELGDLIAAAQTGYLGKLPAASRLKGERVYGVLPANLLGDDADAMTDAEPGHLIVTDRRIVFAGAQERSWSLRSRPQFRHVGLDRTLLSDTGDATAWTGISYPDATVARLYLELALAGSHHARVSFLRNVVQGLNDNEMRRPEAPVPAAPLPGLRRADRTKAYAWYAAALTEAEELRALTDLPVVLLPIQRMPFEQEQLPALVQEPPTVSLAS